MGLGPECSRAGCLEADYAVFGFEAYDAEDRAKSLLGVGPFFEQGLNERPGLGSDSRGVLDIALRCLLGVATMTGRHTGEVGARLVAGEGHCVTGYSAILEEDLNDLFAHPHVDDLADEGVGDGEVVPEDHDVVVPSHAHQSPGGELVRVEG